MLYRRGKASQDLCKRVFAASDDGERAGEVAKLLRASVPYVSKALTRRRTTGEITVRAQHGHKLPKLAPFYTAIRAGDIRSRNCRSPIEMSLPSPLEMSLGQAVVETFGVACDDGDPNERTGADAASCADDLSDRRLPVEAAARLIGVGRRQVYRLRRAFAAGGPVALV